MTTCTAAHPTTTTTLTAAWTRTATTVTADTPVTSGGSDGSAPTQYHGRPPGPRHVRRGGAGVEGGVPRPDHRRCRHHRPGAADLHLRPVHRVAPPRDGPAHPTDPGRPQ